VTPHVLTGRTEAERRAERRALLEQEAREQAETERRIRDAWAWAERHRVTPLELLQAVDTARNLAVRLGRPLSLAEIADCLPPPKGPNR